MGIEDVDTNKLYQMKLHEKVVLQGGLMEIMRVPGGWIYTRLELNQTPGLDGQWSENYLPSSVFIPFKDEADFTVSSCQHEGDLTAEEYIKRGIWKG